MKTFAQIGTEVGELVEQKNAAYGDSVAVSGDFLTLLYPSGLKPEQYRDALLLVRIFDKLKRIATNRDAFGETPFGDICGYGILGTYLHQQTKENDICGIANMDAESPSEVEQPVSAELSVRLKTQLSASTIAAHNSTPKPSGYAERITSAPASIATEAASQSAAGLLPELSRRQHEALKILAVHSPIFIADNLLCCNLQEAGIDTRNVASEVRDLAMIHGYAVLCPGHTRINDEGLSYLSKSVKA